MNRTTLTLALGAVSLNAAAQIALKAAVGRAGYFRLEPSDLLSAAVQVALQAPFWLGMACYAVSLGLWLVTLSRVEVSLAYPFLSVGYVINAFAAARLLGEHLSLQRLGGIAVIILGVYILGRS